MSTEVLFANAFETEKGLLWGLCYRMTGCAADADDIVQETFIKALESPPPDLDKPLRPWLVRVAMNLSRDYLRRRRRGRYVGPWLPSPLPTDEARVIPSFEPGPSAEGSPMARYEMLESVSFAFLLALEALTPVQRAVLLLRDVFDYSTGETAEALDLTEPNVKVLLHRARHKMQDYDKNPALLNSARTQATQEALEHFLLYLHQRNVPALEALLREDAVLKSDGGGEVRAALNTISGREKVLKLIFGLAKKARSKWDVSFVTLNGLPAAVLTIEQSDPNLASLYTLHCEVDASGRIQAINLVAAPSKLKLIKAHVS